MRPTFMKLGLIGLLALAIPACSRAPVTPERSASASVTAPAPSPVAVPAPAPVPVPASVPAPAPVLASAPAHRATELRVDRLVVARGVVDREPQGADTIFGSNEKRIFAFVEVANPEHAPGDLKVQFVAPDGVASAPVDLAVGPSARWRTWAFSRQVHTPGTWKALVRDGRGHVLASTEFGVRG